MADKITDYQERLAEACRMMPHIPAGRYSITVDQFGTVHVRPSREAELEEAVRENHLLMVEKAQRVTELEEANAQLCDRAREMKQDLIRLETELHEMSKFGPKDD